MGIKSTTLFTQDEKTLIESAFDHQLGPKQQRTLVRLYGKAVLVSDSNAVRLVYASLQAQKTLRAIAKKPARRKKDE